MTTATQTTLDWQRRGPSWEQATLPNPDGTIGVYFTLSHHPTCRRRGPYLLLVEVAGGLYCHRYGWLDWQDWQGRNYHDLERAKAEAQAIADVLVKDFVSSPELREK